MGCAHMCMEWCISNDNFDIKACGHVVCTSNSTYNLDLVELRIISLYIENLKCTCKGDDRNKSFVCKKVKAKNKGMYIMLYDTLMHA